MAHGLDEEKGTDEFDDEFVHGFIPTSNEGRANEHPALG
jgi:hypothetical protein